MSHFSEEDEVNLLHRGKSERRERGQIIPLLALVMVVLILFAGFAIDLGFAYVAKANLSKAVDAAALMAARNISQGQATATTLAQSAFAANYGSATPVPVVTFPAGPANTLEVNVTASATLNTYFLRVLPQWKTLSVSSSATALRANAGLTMVLDISGSMTKNGGQQALPVAVKDFLGYFDDARDQVGMTSFASNEDPNLAPQNGFTSTITNAVNNFTYQGGTFTQGGLLNAQTWENNIAGANIRKAVVFFTDGWANANEDTLNCGGFTGTIQVIYGGCSPVEAGVLPQTDGNYINPAWCQAPANGTFFWTPQPGQANNTNQVNCSANTFPAQKPGNGNTISNSSSAPPGVTGWIAGTQGSTTEYYIAQDAAYRAIQLAKTMRTQGTIVYAVGLGKAIDQTFLQQLANDPNYPATYDNTQPPGTSGLAVWASDCPGANCTLELQTAFETVATDILLRLTQ